MEPNGAAVAAASADSGKINNLQGFQNKSRLHFIGSWVNEATGLLRQFLEAHPQHDHSAVFGEQKIVCHVDMDCFFVLVALSKPENAHLRGKPVAVASSTSAHSEISSCSYEARRFGIRAGTYMKHAKRLCPELAIVPYDFERVRAVNQLVYRAAFELCPPGTHVKIQIVSVDEFYVAFDTASFDLVEHYCVALRERMERESNGCTASCGVAPNVPVARAVTALAKPNGIKVVRRNYSAPMPSAPAATSINITKAGNNMLGMHPQNRAAASAAAAGVDPTNAELVRFVRAMSVDEIHGVGRVALEKLRQLQSTKSQVQQQQQQQQSAARSTKADPPVAAVANAGALLMMGAAGVVQPPPPHHNPQRRERDQNSNRGGDDDGAGCDDDDHDDPFAPAEDEDDADDDEIGLSGEERDARRERERQENADAAAAAAPQQQQQQDPVAAPVIRIGDLCGISADKLKKALGNSALAEKLHRLAHHAEDHTLVIATGSDAGGSGATIPKAVGTSMNYAVRLATFHELSALLLQLCKDVATKLERAGAAAMLVKLTMLIRHPEAPLVPPKHLGCGHCVERVLGTAKAISPQLAFHTPEKLHDTVMPFALKAVTVDESSQPPQQIVDEAAVEAAMKRAMSGPIPITEIRGLTLHCGSIVPLARAKNNSNKKDAGLMQISLTASFRSALEKQQQKQQQRLRGSSAIESLNVDDDDDDDDDDGEVLVDETKTTSRGGAPPAKGQPPMLPNSHQAKKLKEQGERAKAARSLVVDDDGAVVVPSQTQRPPAPKKAANNKSNDDDDVTVLSVSPKKPPPPPLPALARGTTNSKSAAATVVLSDDDSDCFVPVKLEPSKLSSSKSVAATNTNASAVLREELGPAFSSVDDLFDEKLNPFAGIARVNAAICDGTIMQLLLMPPQATTAAGADLRALAASIVLAEAALPTATKGQRFAPGVVEAAARV